MDTREISRTIGINVGRKSMDSTQIERYLGFLGQKLGEMQIKATIILLGGALVFVNDIGGQFLIRIGARDFFECVADNQIWGPCDNEKGSHLAFATEKGSHLQPAGTHPSSSGGA